MRSVLKLGDLEADLIKKDIKNIHLSVYPPTGRVRISAPNRMKTETIRSFALSKIPWIKREQKKLLKQERETRRDYVERESHYVWGQRCLLKVVEEDCPPTVDLRHKTITLHVRPNSNREKRAEIVETWYRNLVKEALPELIQKWEPILKVKVHRTFVSRMKTKWGSCNPKAENIRINSELAKKPKECLEYIVVHEMVHLLEPTHNDRFIQLMDRFLPQWKERRLTLNRLPVSHEDWSY